MFLSSHNLAEVEQLADRVGIIREGQIVAVEEVGGLRARRMRRMDVQLQAAPGDGFLDGLQGVRIVASRNDGMQLELALKGSPGELLGRQASTHVLDLVYPPPDLESVFLGYYGADDKGGGQR